MPIVSRELFVNTYQHLFPKTAKTDKKSLNKQVYRYFQTHEYKKEMLYPIFQANEVSNASTDAMPPQPEFAPMIALAHNENLGLWASPITRSSTGHLFFNFIKTNRQYLAKLKFNGQDHLCSQEVFLSFQTWLSAEFSNASVKKSYYLKYINADKLLKKHLEYLQADYVYSPLEQAEKARTQIILNYVGNCIQEYQHFMARDWVSKIKYYLQHCFRSPTYFNKQAQETLQKIKVECEFFCDPSLWHKQEIGHDAQGSIKTFAQIKEAYKTAAKNFQLKPYKVIFGNFENFEMSKNYTYYNPSHSVQFSHVCLKSEAVAQSATKHVNTITTKVSDTQSMVSTKLYCRLVTDDAAAQEYIKIMIELALAKDKALYGEELVAVMHDRLCDNLRFVDIRNVGPQHLPLYETHQRLIQKALEAYSKRVTITFINLNSEALPLQDVQRNRASIKVLLEQFQATHVAKWRPWEEGDKEQAESPVVHTLASIWIQQLREIADLPPETPYFSGPKAFYTDALVTKLCGIFDYVVSGGDKDNTNGSTTNQTLLNIVSVVLGQRIQALDITDENLAIYGFKLKSQAERDLVLQVYAYMLYC